METAIAHVVRNKVEAACARSDLFEKRRTLVESGRTTSPPDGAPCVWGDWPPGANQGEDRPGYRLGMSVGEASVLRSPRDAKRVDCRGGHGMRPAQNATILCENCLSGGTASPWIAGSEPRVRLGRPGSDPVPGFWNVTAEAGERP